MQTGAAVSPVAGSSPRVEPIRVEIEVPCPPDRAFAYFTRDIARWWPMGSHSVSEAACANVTLDARVGGTIHETAQDGTRHIWGTLTRCDEGARLDFTWHPGRSADLAQWVEVRFVPVARGTRVELTQGGWDVLDEGAAEARKGYLAGWTMIVRELYSRYCVSSGANG